MRSLLNSSWLLATVIPFVLPPAFAQITTGGIEVPPSYEILLPPAAGASYSDPVFGTSIARVTNAPVTPDGSQPGLLTWIENEYSTMSPFNGDNSRFILIHQSYFALYDGSGTYLNDLPFEMNALSEPRWSRNDLVTLYYHVGNQIRSYNTATHAINVLHTFGEYSAISGKGEMDISFDGDHLVYTGDNEFIFVYEISTDTKYGVFDAGTRPFDSVYISPRNNVIVSWLTSGTARFTGQELFDINMNFLRQVGHADGHKHLAIDTNGDEILVWNNSNDPQPIACNNGIVKIHLADAVQTCLLQLDWSLGVHIAGADGNGTIFVDTEGSGDPEPNTPAWVPYTNEILQIKLDGSGVTRWAHHRSRPDDTYDWEPKLASSRDGTRLLYASNFNLAVILGYQTEYADTYSMVLPATGTQTSPAVIWPAPATITYTTTLGANQLNARANVPGSYVYNPALGTILNAGTAQPLSVTFTPANPIAYSPVTKTVSIGVTRLTPTITWAAPAAIAFGSALSATQLNATASVAGTFAYTPAIGTVLPPGSQTLKVLFTPADSTDYTTASAYTTVTVNPPAVTPVNIVVTKSLSRNGSNIVVVLTVSNTGGTGAANTVITSLKVGTTAGAPLPQSLGTIAGGSSVQATFTVPGTAGLSGTASSLVVAGTYTGGSFTSTSRLTLP